jgi:hypothetical protein
MNASIAVTLPRRRLQNPERIAHTVKSQPPTPTCTQMLHIRSMVISPDSKRGQRSTGIGVPGFPAMLPGPARKSPKFASPFSSALNPGVREIS